MGRLFGIRFQEMQKAIIKVQSNLKIDLFKVRIWAAKVIVKNIKAF